VRTSLIVLLLLARLIRSEKT